MSSGIRRFSNKNRKERLTAAQQEVYDLVVIGGGITGAGILLDAALRGLKVLLVEKKDFASGTSSKSTKLIHGGLRYLKQLEFGLVRETGLERSIAHANACHLVHPENMFLPIVHNGTFSKWTASMAISVYDFLAKVPSKDRKVIIDKDEALEMEPLLDKEKVKSAIVYSEYRTDDARLTLELIKAGRRHTGEAFNYLEASDFEAKPNNKGVKVVTCTDSLTSDTYHFQTRQIVNATGPWADKVRLLENDSSDTNLRLSKGAHIVISKEKLPIQRSIYFDAFDGRMLFAIPRSGVVYVGTTDTDYKGNLDKLTCNLEDVNYILNAVNGFFDGPTVQLSDVLSSWVGLRPLIHQKGKPPTELSRKDEIFVSDSGMITIAGGKLTGFRKMAERVVDLVLKESKMKLRNSTTENFKIHHDPFSNYEEYTAFVDQLTAEYKELEVSSQYIKNLCSTYGKDVGIILDKTKLQSVNSEEEIEALLLQAQLDYCVEYESILHPMDFLDRRTGWLFFDMPRARQHLPAVLRRLEKELQLSEVQAEALRAQSLERIEINSLDVIKNGNETRHT